MPPTRSMPPAKAVKTERTHEENQERAYIAASRRSDRSLEARVESARRASEIHKRRTGRSLRVTEQDVQNEEMYEEEDDDLPLQYRRLTAHLQTGSADFNRRLSAYLTNHVAMRSALEQSIHNSYAQQFPNAPQYQTQSMFPSPMLAHQQQQQQQQMMQPPQSPNMYRHQPYPSPRQPGFSVAHQRANSVAVPSQSSASGSNSPDVRRSNSVPGSSQDNTSSEGSTPSATSQQQKPSFPPGSFSQANPMQSMNNNQPQAQFSLPSYDMGAFGHSQFPAFTTQLPAESQGLLGSTLNPSDPLTNMMMAGSQGNNFWDFIGGGVVAGAGLGGNAYQKVNQPQQYAPSLAGLNSTLAPAELSRENIQATPAPAPVEKAPIKIEDSTQVDDLEDEDANIQPNFFENAIDGLTPGLNGDSWDSWINDGSWDVPPTSSQ